MIQHICEQCGKALDYPRQKRFCSRECLHVSMRRVVKNVCQQCGKEFERKPWQLNHPGITGQFCSRQCAGKAMVGHPSYMPDPTEERKCEACGKSFIVGGRGRPEKDRRFCSMACQRAARYRKSDQHCHNLSPTQAAYLAGIIDGEGSIMLVTRGFGGVHCRVTVANTYLPLIDYVLESTGIGGVYRQREATETHKAGYTWRCHAEGTEELLRQIRPYLIIKAAQADLAIETQERLRPPALKADRTWQAEYQERMKALNRRGIA